jgi:acylpyruvate hydrolase
MRLATLARDGATEAVVLDDGLAVPVPDGAGPFADVGALLRAPGGLEAARAAAAAGDGARPHTEAELVRPVLEPGAVFCVGLNYRNHILEMGRELPSHPTLFSKLARSLTDPFGDVTLPAASEAMDYEGELAIVIGTAGWHIDPAEAWDHVAGLTILNDVTARDFQHRTLQWFAGKTFQRSTPVGPEIVTADEFGDPAGKELLVTVNGDERQRADLGDLLFDVPALVADISRIVELAPGDLIATGTPGGVGDVSRRYLADGDVVEVSITGVGSIRNTFRGA